MKRFFTILFLLTIVVSLSAKSVTKDEAIGFAQKFIQHTNGYTIISIDEIRSNNEIFSYLISLKPTGFVIVSAEDKVDPLLAYSFESKPAKQNEWPEHLTWWVDNTGKSIIEKGRDINAKRSTLWETDGRSILKSSNQVSVAPILKVRWDQGRNWNMFCPEDEDGPGGRTWVGCVAVSMAQAMSIYGYPEKGKGKASYIHQTYGTQTVDFEKQQAYVWDSMPSGSANEYNARLLYNAAVTVNMDFGPDGSGAYTKTTVGALKNYFNYSKSIYYMSRPDDDEEWKSILNENLKLGYPIIYHGDGDNGEAGHAWNIDGVDAQGLYHLNWGWSGSMNGYFNINNLAPGPHDFTKNQGAVLGIKPKAPGPIDIILSNNSVREKLPAGSFVATVYVDDEYPENIYTYNLKGNPIIIGDGFAAPKFYIENDTLKTIEEFDFNRRDNYTLFIEAVDTLGNSLEKQFIINIEKAVGFNDIINADLLKTFPNPFSNELTVETKTPASIYVYNFNGQLLVVIPSNGELKHQINLSELKNGAYLLKAQTNNEVLYRRILKN